MKKIKLKIKITPKKIIFWFYFLVIMISLLILGSISFFLYEHLYQTITQSKEIIILKEKVAFEVINTKKFDAIIGKIDQKTLLKTIKQLNNPFD